MKFKLRLSLFVFLSLLFIYRLQSQDNTNTTNIRQFVNLIDYIGSDYHNAVKSGTVTDSNEYKEMNEFISKSIVIFESLDNSIPIKSKSLIKNDLITLKSLIDFKSNSQLIFETASKIKLAFLKLNIIPSTPAQMPNLANGAKIFASNCSSCHNDNGNGEGILGKNLNPKPANLIDFELMKSVSTFQIYNTIRLGINGTSMAPFNNLNDAQVWDLAFYVNSIRHKNEYKLSQDSLNKLYDKAMMSLTLNDLTTLPDLTLRDKIKNDMNQDSILLYVIRTYSPNNFSKKSIKATILMLNELIEVYKVKDYQKSSQLAMSSYLDGIEPFESQLISTNPKLKTDLEFAMFQIRNDIKNQVQIDKFISDINAANKLIEEANSIISTKAYSFWFTFFMAMSIILREGIEAILIIVTILGVLKSLKAQKAEKFVHLGWVTALIIGIASLYYIDLIISFGSFNRELIEGIGSAIAVILLLYIGFWLHSKSEAKKWKEFVEDKIVKLLNGKNMIGLAIISFIVVFREAFESAIFLSAINIESTNGIHTGVYYGGITSLILVIIVAWLIMKSSRKLPIFKLFKYSSIVISVFSIILAGKCIYAFQEIGISGITHLPFNFNLPLLGIYPTLETISFQLIVLMVTIVLWKSSKRNI